jgi:hypothetical protein
MWIPTVLKLKYGVTVMSPLVIPLIMLEPACFLLTRCKPVTMAFVQSGLGAPIPEVLVGTRLRIKVGVTVNNSLSFLVRH